VLHVTAPKTRTLHEGEDAAHDGCSGGICTPWVQFKFDYLSCESREWQIVDMNGNEPGKQIYLFEIKYTTHQDSLVECEEGKGLSYTTASPCLPRRKPSRIQGYCVYNQQIQTDGAEHCFNDVPGYKADSWLKWIKNKSPGHKNWKPYRRFMSTPTARNSLACLQNKVAAGDIPGSNGSSIPVVSSAVLEVYQEEFLYPIKTGNSQGSRPGSTVNVLGGYGFDFRINSDYGEVVPSWRHLFLQHSSFGNDGGLPHCFSTSEYERFSPYPRGCRYNSGAMFKAGNCGVEETSGCCSMRHMHSKMMPVDVAVLRQATVLDLQSSGMIEDGNDYAFEFTCQSLQGKLVFSWWYLPAQSDGECRTGK